MKSFCRRLRDELLAQEDFPLNQRPRGYRAWDPPSAVITYCLFVPLRSFSGYPAQPEAATKGYRINMELGAANTQDPRLTEFLGTGNRLKVLVPNGSGIYCPIPVGRACTGRSLLESFPQLSLNQYSHIAQHKRRSSMSPRPAKGGKRNARCEIANDPPALEGRRVRIQTGTA